HRPVRHPWCLPFGGGFQIEGCSRPHLALSTTVSVCDRAGREECSASVCSCPRADSRPLSGALARQALAIRKLATGEVTFNQLVPARAVGLVCLMVGAVPY